MRLDTKRTRGRGPLFKLNTVMVTRRVFGRKRRSGGRTPARFSATDLPWGPRNTWIEDSQGAEGVVVVGG